MAGEEVAISMGKQEVAVDQFGRSTDGSDHERTLADLKSKFCETSPSSSSSKLQCPKVLKKLRSGAETDYAPKHISLGPYYHGEPSLVRGETLKLKLAENYIQRCGQTVDEIYKMISRRIKEMRGCYDEESTKKYKDDEFTAMMLVDGCALLRYILYVCLGEDDEDYDIGYQDLTFIHQDVLLLENQLPYDILLYELMKKIVEPESAANDIWKVIFLEFFGMNDESFFQEFFGINEYSFLRKMKNYCCRPFHAVIQIINGKAKPKSDKEWKPCHLLDLYRRNFLGDEHSTPTHSKPGDKVAGLVGLMKEQFVASFRNVKELMAAGIRIKRSPTRDLRDISFRSNGITACLRIPAITIDSSTKATFLNLIAYEMSSDGPHDFISYLRFLDSLIDHADDVKELQSAGVLQNNLGTHEVVAQFFNTVSVNLESDFHAYKDVRVKIRKHFQSHYNSRLKVWMTQCLDIYFGSPWTIIAWLGAALALFFTAVQTYFSVFPH